MKRNLLKSSYVVSSMTVLSRIVGLAREIIFASCFGASPAMDAFLVAFRIPNFLRRLFAEGAFAQAFVPILSEYRQQRSHEEVKDFVDRIAGTLFLALFLVTLVAVIATPILTMIFAPGYLHDPLRFHLASTMLKITFPYLLFISLTAFAGSILNSYDLFSVPAITPVLLNISLICSAIFLTPYFHNKIYALAWGVFIGGVVQLAFQIPFLKRLKLLPFPKIALKDSGVMRVLKLMLPAIFGVSVAQISLLIDTLFASFLPSGSITWLYFSDRLTNFPLGVFGVAIATVILPHLSRKHADNNPQEFSASLDWGIRLILFIAIPAALGLFLLAGPLFATILEHGKFGAFDVIMARKSLMAFAIGLPSFMLVKVLATGFYSKQNIKTPVKVAAIAMVANMFLNLALIFPLAHAGLALATSLTTSINAFLLGYLLKKYNIYQPQPGWLTYLARLLFANLAMALFLYFYSAKLSIWLAWNARAKIEHLLVLLAGAILIYFASLLISGIRPKDLILNN
ncbi:MAG: murein biosynthesis integral membrane protein MurJ [Gammaproteobacteria bacterium]|nr:murein biosynthesis integral membrane protein MurJ [Gammaproteobacteria bacterium]